MSYVSILSNDFSPVRLNYIGALRGLRPRSFDASFAYAQVGTYDLDALVCMASSNQKGQFYGVVATESLRAHAQKVAAERSVANVQFVLSLSDLPEDLNYLVADYGREDFASYDTDALFSAAHEKLAAGGSFCYRYKAYGNLDEILQFLIAEYEAELKPDQALSFLLDVKNLGVGYFAEHPIAKAALDKAISAQNPSLFFEACRATSAAVRSGTFQTMAGLLPRNFSFVGDADYGANYMELAAPIAAHAPLQKCQGQLHYEPIKDFALGRLVRNDVWVKLPVEQTFENPVLFGSFTFGITMPRETVPAAVQTQAGAVHLSTPIFSSLVDLLTMIPAGIGDFLAHPSGQGFQPDEVVAAINVLVACGIATPMAGRYEGKKQRDRLRPVWSNSYNAHWNKCEISAPTVFFSSAVTGSTVCIGAREALVLQAVNRAGLSLCAGALLAELRRLQETSPFLVQLILGTQDITDEVIHKMVVSVLTDGMSRWYAYGLLAA